MKVLEQDSGQVEESRLSVFGRRKATRTNRHGRVESAWRSRWPDGVDGHGAFFSTDFREYNASTFPDTTNGTGIYTYTYSRVVDWGSMGRQSYGSPLERLGLTFQLSDGPSWNSRPAAWLRPKSLVRVAGEVVSTDVRVWTHSVGNTGVVLHGCRCYIRACSGGFWRWQHSKCPHLCWCCRCSSWLQFMYMIVYRHNEWTSHIYQSRPLSGNSLTNFTTPKITTSA